MSALNLLPASLVEQRLRARGLARWAFIAGSFGACALAVGVGVRVSSSSLVHGDGARLQEVTLQAESQREAIERLRAEARDLAHRADIAAEVRRRPDWSLLLALLADSRGGGVVLERVSLTPAGASAAPSAFDLEVTGLAEHMPLAQEYVLTLESSGLFSSVRLLETSRVQAHGGEAVGFSIALRIDAHGEGGER